MLDDQSGSRDVWFKDESSDWFGLPVSRNGTRWAPLPPGPVDVACGSKLVDGVVAHATVMDPDALWVPFEPACADGSTDSMTDTVSLTFDDPHPAATIRATVAGLRPTDQIIHSGYPSTANKIPTFSVLRDDAVVARVYQLRQLHVVTCSESGIAPLALSSEPGSTANSMNEIDSL